MSDSIPTPSWRVRRRRRGGFLVLILDNYFHQIDDLADSVWRGLCGTRSRTELIARVEAETRRTPEYARVIVEIAIEHFSALGLFEQ